MAREKHRTSNVVVHDWQTTDRVCERCAGTFGKLEQTPDQDVTIYRCWCGKVTRIVKGQAECSQSTSSSTAGP